MFSLDDRAGNVITTVALFAVAATILYFARGAFFIVLLSLLFAYLLDPVVTWVQQHSWLGQKNRAWAISQVYLVGAGRGNRYRQRWIQVWATPGDAIEEFERGCS
jgi:predicted PurR-regulated permease PerM